MTAGHFPDSPARILAEYDRVLAREAHYLIRRPDLLPQQLLNELQWVDPPITAAEEDLSARMRTPTRPWIHRRNPLRQASALEFVLDTGPPSSCRFGPRGDVIAAGHADGTLTVWDAVTGRQKNSAVVSPGYPPFIAGDPDFRLLGFTGRVDLVCLEDRASILRIRDAVTLASRGELAHATWDVRACAVTESKSFVLLESRGDHLRAWAQEGSWTESDRDGGIVAAAIDNALVASVSAGGAVTVRDARWRSMSVSDPFVADTVRWQAPSRSAEVVACAVNERLGAVLLAHADGTLWIGDAATGQEHGALDAGMPALISCALGPDFVVVGGRHGTVRLLDLRTLGLRFETHVGDADVTGCGVSPDGSFAVCGAGDGALTVLEAATGDRRGGFTATTGAIRACGVSAEGDAVVAATDRGCLEGWWHESGTKWFVAPGPYEVRDATTSITGDRVCAVTADGMLRVWETGPRVEHAVAVGVGPAATCVAMGPAGDRVLVGSEDGVLRLVDAGSGDEIARQEGHAKAVTCAVIGPDGRHAFSGGADGAVKAWDLPDLVERFTIAAHTFGVGSCAVAPDGSYLVTGSGGTAFGGPAKIWDAQTGEEIATLDGWDDENPACAVSPDAGFVATVGRSKHVLCVWRAERSAAAAGPTLAPGPPLCTFAAAGEVVFFGRFDQLSARDPGTGRPIFDVGELPEQVWVCAVSPDGQVLVTGGREGTVRLWDVGTGELRRELSPTVGVTESWLHREQCLGLAVSPVGDLVFSTEFGGGTRVWNLRTGAEWLLDTSGRLTPDAATLAVQDEHLTEDENRISFLDIRTGDPVRTTAGRLGLPLPDWSTFLSCSDGTLRLWDAATGTDLGSVQVHDKDAHAAAVTRDGRFLVTGSDDCTVRVTRLADLTVIATIPTLASVESLDLHPWLPLAAAGDFSGNLYLLDLVGVEYGPIYCTAVDEGVGPVLRCPRCAAAVPVPTEGADEIVPCPTPGCGLRLRADGFTARPFTGEPAADLRTGARVPRMRGLAGVLARSTEERDRQAQSPVPVLDWPEPASPSRDDRKERRHPRERRAEPADLMARLNQWAGEEPPRPSRWKQLFRRK